MSLPYMDMPPADERPDLGPALVLVRPIDATTADDADPMDLAVLMLRRLLARRRDMELWDAYYRGDHPLPWFTERFREVFRASFRRFRTNFTQLVVDGISERLEVQGFSFQDAAGDADLWEIWQDNNLDGGSQQAHTEALIKGACYTLVEPGAKGGYPTITIEDALCAITLEDPRSRRHSLAGLKTWIDDSGYLVVYLYRPDEIHTFRTAKPATDGWTDWLRGEARMIRARLQPWTPPGQTDPVMRNPLGVVPLVPLLNRPLLDGIGRSEIDPIMSNQDAINFLRGQALITARYMAVPQRYIYGLDLDIDPDTGRPVRPFVAADGGPADLMVMGNPDPDRDTKPTFPPQIGQFAAADLAKYVDLIKAEIGQMAAVSRMPFQELLTSDSQIPQSGEALKSSEAPLLRKVGKTMIHFGEGWEETMRVALRAMNDDRADIRMAETLWQSAETRNEAVRTDSVVKQRAADIIDGETALEELGYTPARIVRIKRRLEAETAAEPTPPPVPPVAPPMALVPAPTGPQMSPALPVQTTP